MKHLYGKGFSWLYYLLNSYSVLCLFISLDVLLSHLVIHLHFRTAYFVLICLSYIWYRRSSMGSSAPSDYITATTQSRIAFALLHKRPECFWINILIMWCLRETPCYYMWFDLICHASYFNLIYMCNEMLSPKETNACDHTSPIMARFISLFNYVPCMYYSPLLPFFILKELCFGQIKEIKEVMKPIQYDTVTEWSLIIAMTDLKQELW